MRTSTPRAGHYAMVLLIPLFVCLIGILPAERADAGAITELSVFPSLASTNSCRWIRVGISWTTASEFPTRLSIGSTNGGFRGAAPSFPGPVAINRIFDGGLGNFNSVSTYTVSSSGGTTSTRVYTVGPFCGDFNAFGERPADYPFVVGYLASPGTNTTQPTNATNWNIRLTFDWATTSDPGQAISDTNFQTVHDNDDYLDWNRPGPGGGNIDPLRVGPVEVIPDSGSGSSALTFRVRYVTGLYSNLNYGPQWRSSGNVPGGAARCYERPNGFQQVREAPGSVSQFNWLYGRTTDPWLDQTGFAQSEYNSRGATEPEVLLIIDGQHWAPHYMIREDTADSNFVDGVTYSYTILPTDYQNFVDNIFLFPFDLPGLDTWDDWSVRLAGRPASNNYVGLSAGPHTYEFWATDDYAPVRNRAWVQVGWPGNDTHTEYIQRTAPEARRVDGLRSAIQRSRFSVFREQNAAAEYTPLQLRRFGDLSVDQPDTYGYALKSHNATSDADLVDPAALASADPTESLRRLPNINPVLTAHPYFGLTHREGGITTPLAPLGGPYNTPDFSLVGGGSPSVAGGYIDNAIPNNTFIAGGNIGANPNPFTPEVGFGPDPGSAPAGPWKYTNDDTILPNFANIWNELAPKPFRGGKWTGSTNFTLRINYWHSENIAPRFIMAYIRRNDPDANPGTWFGYVMERANPADNDYTDGVVFQYQATPDQLPTNSSKFGGGIGEYNYYFEANDASRTVIFPDRPDQFTSRFQTEGGGFGAANINDPGDIGVPSGATGRDYYWFRVNQKPVLTAHSVTPTVGRTGDPFSFRVKYTDIDGQASVPNATGDRPFIAHLYVDLYGDRYGQHSVTAAPANEFQLDYTNASAFVYPNNELAGLFVVMENGPAVRKAYRIVGNTGNTIDLVANPNDPDHPGTVQTDGVANGNLFYIAQRTSMDKDTASSNPLDYDNDYSNGEAYIFNTGTNMILGPGSHRYFFEFADDWGAWIYPNQVDVHVEGEYVRYPNAREFSGPEVIENSAPDLVDYRFVPQDVGNAPDGSTSTLFTFFVTYVDQENDPPSFIRMELDNNTPLNLFPVDANDNVYTDGRVYRSQPIRLTEGQHFMRAQCSDSEERFPPPAAYPPANPLPYKGPIASVTGNVTTGSLDYTVGGRTFPTGRYDGGGTNIRMLDGSAAGNEYIIDSNAGALLTLSGGDPSGDGVATGDTFIFDAAPGPKVAANTAPLLVFPTDDATYAWDPGNPTLPGLEPDMGVPEDTTTVPTTPATQFTYTVIYIDNDQYAGVRGNPPAYVQVYIDNVAYTMTPVDPSDTNYTDDGTDSRGAQYQFTTSNGLTEGTPHTYFFIASDGLDTARLPVLNALPNNRYNGPIVDGRPDPPLQLFVYDRPADNGDAMLFEFNASSDDGGGADDVTEYHLYRSSTTTFIDPPTLVIPADDSPSYAGIDPPVGETTGLVKAADYYYMLRAYDGPTIDPDGDGIPGEDLDNNNIPDNPVVFDPLDQSLDSNIEGPVRAEDNIPPGAPTPFTADDPQLGGTIDLVWGLSPDDSAGSQDVVGYWLFRNQTGPPFSVVTDRIAQLPAGTAEYTDQTAVDGVPYFYAISAYDGANESARTQPAVTPVTSSDGAPPQIINLNPAAGAINVPRATNIEFDVRDTGAGIDMNQLSPGYLSMTVDGQPVTPTITGNAAQIHVTYNPPVDFPYLVAVNVHVEISDVAVPTPNSATLDYSFTIEGPPIYEIEGTITQAGNPAVKVPNVIVRAFPAGGGPALADTTDVDGNYTISGLAAGTYYVVPKLDGLAFTPESSAPLTVPPSPQRADFTAAPGYDIRGTVLDTMGAPLVGARVSDGIHEAITDINGDYEILDVAAGDYTIVPQLGGYAFTPSSVDLALPTAVPPGDADVDFTGDRVRYSISGSVRTGAGARLSSTRVVARDLGNNIVGEDVTDASGAYVIDDLPAQFYVLTPTYEPPQGVLADFVFEPITRDVDLAGDRVGVDFIAVPVTMVALPQGLSMMALPIIPQTLNPMDNLPAGVAAARWDPIETPQFPTPGYIQSNTPNRDFDPLTEQGRMLPGRSFWLLNTTGGPLNLNIPGEPVNTGIPFSMAVERGWNMNGNMFAGTLPWANLQISPGQVVRDYGYVYNGAGAAEPYSIVTDLAGIGTTSTIPRYGGFWLKSDAKRTVMVSPVGTASVEDEAPQLSLGGGDYLIKVAARTASRSDSISLAGVVAGSGGKYQLENPPAVSPYVDVYFVDANGVSLACDVRSSQAEKQSWNFVVSTDQVGANVEISLPDLSGVPADKGVYLTDEITGKRMYARTLPAYTYTADEGGVRKFRLEVAPKSEAGLVVSSAMAQQTGAGAVVTYSLSEAASVKATVMNVAGRTIKVLSQGGASAAGVSTLSWNLRSQTGAKVPAGRYLIRIEAVSDSGQAASAVASLQIAR